MPEYAELVLSMLKKRPDGQLKLSEDVLLPSYGGLGLANLSSTISHWLSGPELASPLLAEELLHLFAPRYKQIMLILVDSLGFYQLERLMAAGKAVPWQKNLPNALFFPLTSISPSTTTSALTSLWTGTTPNTHGIIGYEMWVKSLGMVVNNILQSPITFINDPGGLSRAGFDGPTFLGQEPLGVKLGRSGIETHSFLPSSIGSSGLSSMTMVGSKIHSYISESDLWASARDHLNSSFKKARLTYIYWGQVDTLMHHYGPNDERVAEQFSDFSNGMQRIFLDGLDPDTRKGTLLLLTADHGSIPTPYHAQYELKDHPLLAELLVMDPTCEGRLPFLYIKPGSEATVRSYFESTWPGKFTLITREEALGMNLFGDGPDHPDLAHRVGDLIAINHEDAYLWWAPKVNLMRGRHGGLHPEEMLIPLYALSLN